MNIKSIFLLIFLSFVLHIIIVKSISDKLQLEKFTGMKEGGEMLKKTINLIEEKIVMEEKGNEEIDEDFILSMMERETPSFDQVKDVNIKRSKDIMDSRDMSVSMKEEQKIKDAYQRDYVDSDKGIGSLLRASENGLPSIGSINSRAYASYNK